MKTTDYHYELPAELIARYPLKERSASRMLCLDRVSGKLNDSTLSHLPSLLRPHDVLVFNDTRVIPARLFGEKATGGKLECLVERVLDQRQLLAHIRASKAPKVGSEIVLGGQMHLKVTGRQDALFLLELMSAGDVFEWLQRLGEIPLPPYLEREPDESDKERYQTIFATHDGAVAAPTAGLHFDEKLIDIIQGFGVGIARITLHVGAGTFQPVRVDDVTQHRMHSEMMVIDQPVCDQIAACKAAGGRVIAVGTTVVRALESAAQAGELSPFRGDTDIFIYPGFQFQVVDAMVTNFHLPESTLLMLISAFAGREHVLAAYEHAVRQGYRFYSYGDAMLISEFSHEI